MFWDSRYLNIQCEFIKQLGKHLDGRPGLEFIDIGAIGEWGEMHLMRWTPQQLEETGFTETLRLAEGDNLQGITPAPHLKMGVNDAGGHWLANFTTGQYQLTKLGTWQLMD